MAGGVFHGYSTAVAHNNSSTLGALAFLFQLRLPSSANRTEKATNLQELLEALRTCSDSSIFQHTFQTLAEHHFIKEGFSNDFSHWAFAACNEVELAERLASIDVREFTSIVTLRERIVRLIEEYLQKNPRAATRTAMEPFYLMASDLVVVPTPYVARNLEEFADGLRRVSIHAIYYHFIDARLRLKLNNNDFSVWLEQELDLAQAADRLNRIDIYTSHAGRRTARHFEND